MGPKTRAQADQDIPPKGTHLHLEAPSPSYASPTRRPKRVDLFVNAVADIRTPLTVLLHDCHQQQASRFDLDAPGPSGITQKSYR